MDIQYKLSLLSGATVRANPKESIDHTRMSHLVELDVLRAHYARTHYREELKSLYFLKADGSVVARGNGPWTRTHNAVRFVGIELWSNLVTRGVREQCNATYWNRTRNLD